jgi:hypothetical protein
MEQYAPFAVDGASLVGDPEKTLKMSNEFHKKKLRLAIRAIGETSVRKKNCR